MNIATLVMTNVRTGWPTVAAVAEFAVAPAVVAPAVVLLPVLAPAAVVSAAADPATVIPGVVTVLTSVSTESAWNCEFAPSIGGAIVVSDIAGPSGY